MVHELQRGILYQLHPAGAEEFHTAITEFRSRSRWGFCLYPYTVEQYGKMALWVTEDRKSGLSIGHGGLLGSVFSGPGDAGRDMIIAAMRLGARRLHCFDNGVLPDLYRGLGFVITDRVPFDPELVSPDWDFAAYADRFGVQPDFLTMVLANPDRRIVIEENGRRSVLV